MSSDIFGNLMDWGQAIDKLNQLKQKKILNEHQPGLVRILRYRDNWRLRETVLNYVKDITNPSDDLLTEVLNIVMDENVYYDARIIAVDALASLMNNYKYNKESDRIDKSDVNKKIKALLVSPHPPVFHEAIRRSYQNFANG